MVSLSVVPNSAVVGVILVNKISIDEVAHAIYRNQIQNGGELADYWSELCEQLITLLGGEADDGLDDDSQVVYNVSSEKWFVTGFKTAMQIKNLIE